jgi:hypothetical protein
VRKHRRTTRLAWLYHIARPRLPRLPLAPNLTSASARQVGLSFELSAAAVVAAQPAGI